MKNWREIDIRDVGGLLLVSLVWVVIVTLIVSAVLRPSGTIGETVVAGIFHLLDVIVGGAIAWVMRGTVTKGPPNEPPAEPLK